VTTLHAAFRAELGLRGGVQYRALLAGAAEAADAGLFCRRAVVDHGGLFGACRRHRGHDGNLPRLLHRRDARFDAAQVRAFSPWPTRTTHQTRQKTPRKNVSTRRSSVATSPKARKSIPGS